MSIFGDYPTFSACLISPCLCYFTIAVKPSANASVGSPGMGLPWLSQLCSPVQVLCGNDGTKAGGTKHPGVSGDGCAHPTQPGLSWASPCQRFLACLTKPCSNQLLEQGVVAQLYLCLPSTLCQGDTALFPGLGRVSVQLLGKTISSYLAEWEGWQEDVLGDPLLTLWALWKLLK